MFYVKKYRRTLQRTTGQVKISMLNGRGTEYRCHHPIVDRQRVMGQKDSLHDERSYRVNRHTYTHARAHTHTNVLTMCVKTATCKKKEKRERMTR